MQAYGSPNFLQLTTAFVSKEVSKVGFISVVVVVVFTVQFLGRVYVSNPGNFAYHWLNGNTFG